MTKSSEWNSKSASISAERACEEYCVCEAYIKDGIQRGELDFREGKNNVKLLRWQIERYISKDPVGALFIYRKNAQRDSHNLNSYIVFLKKILKEFQDKKAQIDVWLDQNPMPS